MPKVATAPLPLSQAAPTRSRSREREAAVYPRSTEARVAALEARWEETTPTLATSKDLAELRTELSGAIRGVEVRLIKWIFGAAAGVLLAGAGVVNSLHSRIDSTTSDLRVELRSAITELKEENRAAITELKVELRETNARIDARFEKIDEKFERMDAKFDAVLNELRALRSEAASR